MQKVSYAIPADIVLSRFAVFSKRYLSYFVTNNLNMYCVPNSYTRKQMNSQISILAHLSRRLKCAFLKFVRRRCCCNFLNNHRANFNLHYLVNGIQGFTNKDHSIIKKDTVLVFFLNQCYGKIIALCNELSLR